MVSECADDGSVLEGVKEADGEKEALVEDVLSGDDERDEDEDEVVKVHPKDWLDPSVLFPQPPPLLNSSPKNELDMVSPDEEKEQKESPKVVEDDISLSLLLLLLLCLPVS